MSEALFVCSLSRGDGPDKAAAAIAASLGAALEQLHYQDAILPLLILRMMARFSARSGFDAARFLAESISEGIAELEQRHAEGRQQ